MTTGASGRRSVGPSGLVAGVVALLALLVTLSVGVGSAAAQDGEEPAGLQLAGQTPWLSEDEVFTLGFTTAEELPEGGTLELTLFGALTSREPLLRADADPTLLGDVRDTLSIPTELVPPTEEGIHRLRLRTDGSSSGLPVDDPGVYPLQITVTGPDGDAGPSLLTFVVRMADDARETPLRAAVVLPVHAAPSYGPTGDPTLSDRGRRLIEVRSGLLRRHADVAVTVVPTPETIDALAATDPDLLDDLRSALTDRHVVAGPYVRIDLAAFAATGDLAQPLADQFDAGVNALRRTLRRPLDRHTWAGAGNPTSAALDALARAGVDRAVFRREAIVGESAPVTEPVVVTGAAGQQLDATLSDPGLRAHANAAGDPVLAAHRALADLALLSGPPEEGGVATDGDDAGVVLELAPNRPLPAAFLDALLRGLGDPGPVRAVNLSALFDADPVGEPGPEPGPQVQGIPVAGQDLTTYGNNLSLTRAALGGYESFAGAADPVAVELRRRLLVSGSIDLTEQQRGSYLRATTETIRARTEQVEIADDEAVTLTSREGDIPVTIVNDTGAEVEVEVVFDSDNRLDFPEGARQRVRLTEGANRLEVPVVARASGSFPLRITATSPDGVLTVGRARVTVRSQALSGVGLVLSVGALLVLAAWWLSHWRTARRNRRLVDPEDLPVDTTPLAERTENPEPPSTDDPDPPAPDEPATTDPPADAAPEDPGPAEPDDPATTDQPDDAPDTGSHAAPDDPDGPADDER